MNAKEHSIFLWIFAVRFLMLESVFGCMREQCMTFRSNLRGSGTQKSPNFLKTFTALKISLPFSA